MYEKSFKENPYLFFTFDGLDNEASCGEERMNITVYIQTWWPLTSNNIPLWKRKSFNRVQEIVELLLLQKLSEYRQLISKFLRDDRSGKANSSWIYTALLNLQLHTPAHTQAHALQQSPWPLRGCGDTWKYFDPWMIEKYLETLR